MMARNSFNLPYGFSIDFGHIPIAYWLVRVKCIPPGFPFFGESRKINILANISNCRFLIFLDNSRAPAHFCPIVSYLHSIKKRHALKPPPRNAQYATHRTSIGARWSENVSNLPYGVSAGWGAHPHIAYWLVNGKCNLRNPP